MHEKTTPVNHSCILQLWLGHSTFKITADIYARFDGSSNQKSAKALTWFENTSLAQEMAGKM